MLRTFRDTNLISADLVVVTEDLIDGSLPDRKRDVCPLKKLRARDGIYFITGNHEFFFGHAGWLDQVEVLGMTALENRHVVLWRVAGSLVLAGVTDLTALTRVLQAQMFVKPSRMHPRMLRSCCWIIRPSEHVLQLNLDIAVQLSRHTHGGLAPVVARLFALAKGGYVSGLYDVNGMQLYVNNGTALWPGFAFRLGRSPELTCITLKRAMKSR